MNRRAFALLSSVILLAAALTTPAKADPVELIHNGTFDSGTAPWWWTGSAPAAVAGGQLCAQVAAGTVNPWDAIIGQNDLTLQNGESYELSFDASA